MNFKSQPKPLKVRGTVADDIRTASWHRLARMPRRSSGWGEKFS